MLKLAPAIKELSPETVLPALTQAAHREPGQHLIGSDTLTPPLSLPPCVSPTPLFLLQHCTSCPCLSYHPVSSPHVNRLLPPGPIAHFKNTYCSKSIFSVWSELVLYCEFLVFFFHLSVDKRELQIILPAIAKNPNIFPIACKSKYCPQLQTIQIFRHFLHKWDENWIFDSVLQYFSICVLPDTTKQKHDLQSKAFQWKIWRVQLS